MNIDRDSHNKEHERLVHELLQAKLDGDKTRYHNVESRLNELDNIAWQAKSTRFPELAPYSNLLEAIRQIASQSRMPFPNVPYSKTYRFIFFLSDVGRSIHIVPKDQEAVYAVLLSEKTQVEEINYGGTTESLAEAVKVLNRWYIERVSRALLLNEFPWVTEWHSE